MTDIPENVREASRNIRTLAGGSGYGFDGLLEDALLLCDYIDPPPKTYRIEGELSEEEMAIVKRWKKGMGLAVTGLCKNLLSMVKEAEHADGPNDRTLMAMGGQLSQRVNKLEKDLYTLKSEVYPDLEELKTQIRAINRKGAMW